MRLKYRIVFFIFILIIGLSVGSSISSYFSALRSMEQHLKNNAMPLTVENSYSVIQKNILEPSLIASIMAHDTFLHKWLKEGEKSPEAMSRYLKQIKEHYGLLSTFFVSQESKNYYTPEGIIYKVSKSFPENAWYYTFKDSKRQSEINLDTNEHIDSSMILFINHKMTIEGRFAGAIGVALKTASIDTMLKNFYEEHHFSVFFTDKKGKVILSHKASNGLTHIDDDKHLKALKGKLLEVNDEVYEYSAEGKKQLLTSRYIKELDLYLIVQAKTADFTKDFQAKLSAYIFISSFVALFFLMIILLTVHGYHKKLEQLAHFDPLTSLANRGTFNAHFEKIFSLCRRKENSFALLLLDLDNFKTINDAKGHLVGDEVLRHVSFILKSHIRDSDILARWGGEEFVILLPDAKRENAQSIAEKIRVSIEEDKKLMSLAARRVTASIGISCMQEDDTQERLFSRTDKALYEAKELGKNRFVFSL